MMLGLLRLMVIFMCGMVLRGIMLVKLSALRVCRGRRALLVLRVQLALRVRRVM